MIFIDTHTHLYLSAFDCDRKQVVDKALAFGVKAMLLPNIDSKSIEPMLSLQQQFPHNCFAMMGLHPTSVKDNWEEELKKAEQQLRTGKFHAVGEVGLDFYRDTTYRKEQEIVFSRLASLAIELNLPLVIHSRKSLDDILMILKRFGKVRWRGIFHCFPGSVEQAIKVVELGFMLGIGGVITFPKSTLGAIVRETGLAHVVLETDAPFIAPAPYRGQRNESAYLPLIAQSVADHTYSTLENVASITSQNACNLFTTIKKSTCC